MIFSKMQSMESAGSAVTEPNEDTTAANVVKQRQGAGSGFGGSADTDLESRTSKF